MDLDLRSINLKKEKLDILKEYNLSLSENSIYPGYLTEKLIELGMQELCLYGLVQT